MEHFNDSKRGAGLRSGAISAMVLLISPLLLAQSQGTVWTGSDTGPPGGTVFVPLTMALDPGVSVDTLGVAVIVVPVGNAPAPSAGKLSFAPSTGISSPSLSTADPGDIVLAWLGNLSSTDSGHAVTGTVKLGMVTATIPAGALNGHAYTIQITRIEGGVTDVNGSMAPVRLSPVSSAIGPISTSGPPPPVVMPRGIVNSASFSATAGISPGSIASLFGLNLAATAKIGDSIPPSTSLAGTQVLLNGVPAPLFYVSPNQINFQAPVEISGTTAQALVISNGVSSLATSVQVAPVTPAIFTDGASGTGQAAALNENYSLNSARNSAAVGSTISIYATGLGPTNPPFATGQPGGTSPLNNTTEVPAVLIGGAPAKVLFSGLAPGFPGEYQVNAVIPAGTPPGPAVPLEIQIGGQRSNAVTIAVQ